MNRASLNITFSTSVVFDAPVKRAVRNDRVSPASVLLIKLPASHSIYRRHQSKDYFAGCKALCFRREERAVVWHNRQRVRAAVSTPT